MKKGIDKKNSTYLNYKLGLTIIGTSLIILGFIMPTSVWAQTNEQDVDRNVKLKLVPFTGDQNLKLNLIGLGSNPTFLLNGQTGNNSEGYYAFTNFEGQYLAITTGLINKSSQDLVRGEAQFTIGFHLLGENGNYTLAFIDGRINDEGWVDNTYYQEISPNSTKLVNLPELIQSKNDSYLAMDKVTITLEKDTSVRPASFNIDLIRGTILQ
ncbi:hypothetical protein [Candidatus Nitrosocosmicus hydrocola]|uniref:hypothetical protein n=1 Tax=Candidatus Nitrosocosmicus hydrocola TaxID=1826872 RepID=UPI0011E5ECE5|nr:hypothetical protein [Candidatus Nitrosocosmicus hydrocola]